VELGFADKILYTNEHSEKDDVLDSYIFGRRVVFNSLLSKLSKAKPPQPDPQPEPVPEDKSYMDEIETLKNEFEII